MNKYQQESKEFINKWEKKSSDFIHNFIEAFGNGTSGLKRVKDRVHRAISPSRDEEPESEKTGFSLSRYGQMYLSAFNSNGKRNRQLTTNFDDLTDDDDEPGTSAKRNRSSVKKETVNSRPSRRRKTSKNYEETNDDESDSDSDIIPRI